MADGDHAVPAAALGGFVVILRGNTADRLGELVGEGGAVFGRGQTDVGVDRQGRQSLASALGSAQQLTDLSDGPRSDGDEIGGRHPVANASGIRGRGPERRRGHDVRRRARSEDPLGESAMPAPADFDNETLVLERPQMMTELLARNTEPQGENRRGGRLAGKLSEQPGAPGVQSSGGRSRFVENLNVEHRSTVPLTDNPVKGAVADGQQLPVVGRFAGFATGPSAQLLIGLEATTHGLRRLPYDYPGYKSRIPDKCSV